MKNLLFLILAFMLCFFNSCASEDEFQTVDDDMNAVEYSVSFEDVDFSQLKSENDTLSISLIPEVIGDNNSSLRAVTAVKGTITKTNVKTFWTYGKGENLIPKYACGQYTISERYDMTVTVYPGPGRVAMNSEGEWTGWQIDNIGNPQTRYQAQDIAQDNSSTTFRTCVWHVISNVGGVTYPNVWGPFNDPNKARIYYKIFVEEE